MTELIDDLETVAFHAILAVDRAQCALAARELPANSPVPPVARSEPLASQRWYALVEDRTHAERMASEAHSVDAIRAVLRTSAAFFASQRADLDGVADLVWESTPVMQILARARYECDCATETLLFVSEANDPGIALDEILTEWAEKDEGMRDTLSRRPLERLVPGAAGAGRDQDVLELVRAEPPKTVHQPMLFVGLGGTGCKVGAELERALREDLCGPGGQELMTRMPGHDYLPYQLPAFLQFVYADLSDAELREVLPGAALSAEHAAAQHTTHLIGNLVPSNIAGTTRLLQSMYVNLEPAQRAWLPPEDSDPRVAPLTGGAGQLPTVGRAVLHESMRQGGGTPAVLHGVVEATKQITAGSAALRTLGGQITNTVDVFVAFSIAGGTGGGIFYDYLHMIGDHLHRAGVEARIYPLVLMPSAFEAGMGGGRPAKLNAGAALVDLFRLVDAQYTTGREANAAEEGSAVSVRMPGDEHPIALQPDAIQTAFLFGRQVDHRSGDELVRSMASLVLALIGAGPEDRPLSTATFINQVSTRSSPSETGIGRRGVSTAAVASLRIPVGELADVVSSRLLADAVRAMRSPALGAGPVNEEHIREFDLAAGLGELWACAPARQFRDVGIPAKGRSAIMQALADRSRAIQDAAATNERELRARVDLLAAEFRPMEAAELLAQSIDPYHLHRVAFGDPNATDEPDAGGVAALLNHRQVAKNSPAGFDFGPIPLQTDGVASPWRGPLRSTDPSVARVTEDQQSWFHWRVEQHWYSAWGGSERVWGPKWNSFRAGLDRLLAAFDDHLAGDERLFAERSVQLYSTQLGLSYLPSPDDGGLAAFHARIVGALTSHYQRLGPSPTAADLVTAILDDSETGAGTGWSEAVRVGWNNPGEAVAVVRQQLRAAVARRFRPEGDEQPLVPSIKELLAAAVGQPRSPVADADVEHFCEAVADLVPGDDSPAGEGELHVWVSHPGAHGDVEIERLLERSVSLHSEVRSVQCSARDSDSLTVVLVRSGMGLLDVPEARDVIRTWSHAQRHGRPDDRLVWRQRLGPMSHYLLASPPEREAILHGLLNAMWNGWVLVESGTADPSLDPQRIHLRVATESSESLTLELTAVCGLSSWASLIQSYEEWILTHTEPSDRGLSVHMMRALPRDLDRVPSPPGDLLLTLVGLQDDQLREIKALSRPTSSGEKRQIAMFEEFWADTLPAALQLPFQGVQSSYRNLDDLLRSFIPEHRATLRRRETNV